MRFAEPDIPSEFDSLYDYYQGLGNKWYRSHDDPIAFLRAEAHFRNPWVVGRVQEFFAYHTKKVRILDVGCGAGFLSNTLAREGFDVTAVDLSKTSLQVAQAHDETKSVKYLMANANHLPFANECFDVIVCTDILENVAEPQKVIQEISRLLRVNGFFFFQTYNRTWLSWLLMTKFHRWFIRNTPKGMHAFDLFIKPKELRDWLGEEKLEVIEMYGVRPRLFQWPVVKLFLTGKIDPRFRFKWTSLKSVSYAGIARKTRMRIY